MSRSMSTWAIFTHEAFLRFFEGHAGEDFLDEFGDTFGFGRTRHDGVDSECRALGELGKTAGQRELHGLRRAVVGHLGEGLMAASLAMKSTRPVFFTNIVLR